MASGITDSSLIYHLQNAKSHGVTKEEIAAIITHATMYVGWPKGWAMFRLAKEVWNEEAEELTDKDRYQNTIFFPIGEPNPYGEFFVGQSYLVPVSKEQIPVFNVTFEPGCRDCSVATKSELVEILEFTHLYEHFTFEKTDLSEREKHLKKYIRVIVAVELDTVGAKPEPVR